MVPVVLSILVVVLISAAVLWVVAGEVDQPTSAKASPAEPAPPVVETAPVEAIPVAIPVTPPATVPARRPATSRRRPPSVSAPAAIEVPIREAPRAVAMAPSPPRATARVTYAPLPRHRFRSSVLLVLLIAVVGVLLAVVIGAVLAALAFALRAAVTS